MSALSPGLLAQLTARHQLRAPVGDFVGREKEIQELLSTLRGGGSAAITGISGMGGIGKTELAFYVAERLRDTYPDAQLVLDMRGTDDVPRAPADALASCIRAFLGLEQRLPDDTEQLTQLYRSVLEEKRALILLDNAYDSTQVRALRPPPGSALLITSRNAIALPGMQRTTLEQLEPSEARKLLIGICQRVADDVADQICYLCGYLPLAIRAAGSVLDVTVDLDPSDYAAQLRDERTRLELLGAEGIDISVEASFNLSYARLSTDAARVFRQLAVFPATFDAAAEEAICEDPGHKHLSELLRRNLVIYNPGIRRYRLHDLARLFADALMSEAERSVGQMRHATHYLLVLKQSEEAYSAGGEAVKRGLALFDAERRNIAAGQERVCQQAAGDNEAADLCKLYPDGGVGVLGLRQDPRERILWLEAALAASRQLKDRVAEGAHLGNLGTAYYYLGEYQRSHDLYGEALIIAREIGNRVYESNSLSGLGVAYQNLAKLEEAIEYHQQALAINRELGNRRAEGENLANLGVAYAKLGEPHRAIEFYEQALVVLRETGYRRGEGTLLGNLGVTYSAVGEVHRSVGLFEQYLSIAREIGDHRGEGNALFYMGLALDNLGDRAQAIPHLKAALEIFEQIESPWAENVRAQLAVWRKEGTEGA